MMGTEIFKIDAPWAQKLTKMRVPFLMTPTVCIVIVPSDYYQINSIDIDETNRYIY